MTDDGYSNPAGLSPSSSSRKQAGDAHLHRELGQLVNPQSSRSASRLTVRSRRRLADTIEDIEWMLHTGETHPEAIAARLGYKPASLRAILYRADRPDLAARITDESRHY